MPQHCYVKHLLAVLLTLQVVVLVIVTVSRHSLIDLSRFLDDQDSADRFLVEYQNYCSSQLIPKASGVALNQTVFFGNLCPCVPDTVGKCLV